MKSYDSMGRGQCNKPVKPSCGCEYVKGNSKEVELHRDDCEVRVDIVVARANGVRIWGQVRDCDGYPVKNALVKLIKVSMHCGMVEVQGVAHTISDCTGFYQFEVSECESGSKYRVLVSKAAEGNERTVMDQDLLCDPCKQIQPPHNCGCNN